MMKFSPLLVSSLVLQSIDSALPNIPTIKVAGFTRDACGYPLGGSSEPGKVFQDSRGRHYTRDAKGTIRRVKP